MSKRQFCGKFVFFTTHIILLFFVLVVILQCLIVFSSWPSYTKIRVLSQQVAGFPSLTICPGSPRYKQEVLKVSEKELPRMGMKNIINHVNTEAFLHMVDKIEFLSASWN